MPITPPDVSSATNNDPLSAALEAEKRANPDMVSVTKPTKFGSLLKFLQPALEGAAVGGFGGRWHPGGGFGAANDFFMRQRMMKMQQGQFLANMLKLQSEVGKNTAETGYYNRGGGTRIGQPVVGDNGNYFQVNPVTRELEDTGVKSPPKNNSKPMMTDSGLVSVTGNRAVPVTLANEAEASLRGGNAESASEPSERAATQGNVPAGMFEGGPTPAKAASKFDSGSPRVGLPSQSPTGISSSVSPLMPPSFGKPKPMRVANRNAAGVETDSLVDENPDSPTFGKTIQPNLARRSPLPDRSENRDNAKKTDTQRAESYAKAAMDKVGNDPDKAIEYLNGLKVADPDAAKDLNRLLPQIRKAVRDRVKPGRTGKRPRITPDIAKSLNLTPTQSSVTGEEDEDENE